MEPYVVEKMVLKNVVKLKLLVSMRNYPVVNVSRVVRYRKPVRRQRVEELKLVKVDGVEKWNVEKILNKRKVKGVMKYLVHWKELWQKMIYRRRRRTQKMQRSQ